MNISFGVFSEIWFGVVAIFCDICDGSVGSDGTLGTRLIALMQLSIIFHQAMDYWVMVSITRIHSHSLISLVLYIIYLFSHYIRE